MWRYTGQQRPPFAETPGPDQESVWDYPRPPQLATSDSLIEVFCGDSLLARTRAPWRVLETASPPTYYLPPSDVDWSLLVRTAHRTYCEWKGEATYWALAGEGSGRPVAWRYEHPSEYFAAIDGYVSFYPGRVACYVDGEHVRPQPGEFYGGWVTSRVVGPFKGEPGTGHW